MAECQAVNLVWKYQMPKNELVVKFSVDLRKS